MLLLVEEQVLAARSSLAEVKLKLWLVWLELLLWYLLSSGRLRSSNRPGLSSYEKIGPTVKFDCADTHKAPVDEVLQRFEADWAS